MDARLVAAGRIEVGAVESTRTISARGPNEERRVRVRARLRSARLSTLDSFGVDDAACS